MALVPNKRQYVSRIPRPVRNGFLQSLPPLSKLQLLKVQYQHKLRQEKEEKLFELFQQNQHHPFFQLGQPDLRAQIRDNSGWRQHNNYKPFPENNSDWKQLKYEQKIGPKRHYSVPNAAKRTMFHKNSAGRDRSRLLAPIDKQYDSDSLVGFNHKPSPPLSKKPALTRLTDKPDIEEDHDSYLQAYKASNTRIQPRPPKYPIPSNSAKVRKVKNTQLVKTNTHHEPLEQMTDFQKWQLEQNSAKELRLAKYHQNLKYEVDLDSPSNHRTLSDKRDFLEDDDEDLEGEINGEIADETDDEVIDTRNSLEEELRRKEAELLSMIQKQQIELEEMQRQRQMEEEEEKQEIERQHQRFISQEERKKKLLETIESDDAENTYSTQNYKKSFKKTAVQNTSAKLRPHADENEELPPLPPQYTIPDDEAYGIQVDLAECPICIRQFARNRLDKHMQICGNKKKRKVFDPVKMRTEGTELQQFVSKKQSLPDQKGKPSSWRKNHENFVKTIRYAKKLKAIEAEGGDVSSLPPPPPMENPDYVQCPHCQRKFNSSAAERHIPRCRELKTRPVRR